MTNRKVAYIIKDQKPVVLSNDVTVAEACRLMWERRAGSVLVVDSKASLLGIFTGRDAVRLLASSKRAAAAPLQEAMTPNPVVLTPAHRAIDALKAMVRGNFRHVPIVENGKLLGVVSRGDFKGMEFEAFDWKSPHLTTHREISSIIKDQKPLTLDAENTVRRACQLMTQTGGGSVLVVDERGSLGGIFTGRDAVRALSEGGDAGSSRLALSMKPHPVTITPGNYAIDALRIMSDGGFRHLPVVENGKIYGVVSRSDFTGIEVDQLDQDEHLAECIW